MATYRAVTWNQNSDITLENMRQISSNIEHVRENTVKSRIAYPNGTKLETGVRILAGRVAIPKGNVTKRKIKVGFGGFFSPGSSPICTITIASSYDRYFHQSIQGLSGLAPDHNGMYIFWHAAKGNNKIERAMWANYICVGI